MKKIAVEITEITCQTCFQTSRPQLFVLRPGHSSLQCDMSCPVFHQCPTMYWKILRIKPLLLLNSGTFQELQPKSWSCWINPGDLFSKSPGVRHSPLLHHEGVPSRNTCSITGEFPGQHMSKIRFYPNVLWRICRWNFLEFLDTNFSLVCQIAEALGKNLLPQCLGLLMPCELDGVGSAPGPGCHWTYKLTFRPTKRNIINQC